MNITEKAIASRKKAQKKYYYANKEKRQLACANWRKNNPEYAAVAWQKWYSENKDRSLAKDYKRKAAKIRAIPAWAELEIIELIYAEAKHRGLIVDHIIPIQGRTVCGLHVHTNLQLLTSSQNSSKGNRFNPIALP